MYSIICLFLWLPDQYDFCAAITKVFNITADQIVSLRKQRKNNIVIFTVASEEIFINLSEFFCRILFFPILGQNILECFVYPESPQYQFFRLSAYPNNAMADTASEYLSGLGTVLYQCYLRSTLLSTSHFLTDTIGVVILMKNETNASAEPAVDPRTSRLRRGNGQEDKTAARRMPNASIAGPRRRGTSHRIAEVISALGLQQPFPKPRWIHYLETGLLQSEFNYHHQGSQIGTFQANEARLCNQIAIQYWGQCSCGNHSSWMGLSSPGKPSVKGKGSAQDEHPSENPTAKDQNPKSSSGERQCCTIQ